MNVHGSSVTICCVFWNIDYASASDRKSWRQDEFGGNVFKCLFLLLSWCKS